MGEFIRVWIEEETKERLERASDELRRPLENLAECAIAEAALDYEKRAGKPE